MSELYMVVCRVCTKQMPIKESSICMLAEREVYVCDIGCMKKLYEPKSAPKPALPSDEDIEALLDKFPFDDEAEYLVAKSAVKAALNKWGNCGE